MSIFEYDEELHKRTLREEGYEEGLEQGKSEEMKQGRSEGMAQGKMEGILEILEELGSIPEEIKNKITSQKDLKVLGKWLKMAAKAESIEQFLINM